MCPGSSPGTSGAATVRGRHARPPSRRCSRPKRPTSCACRRCGSPTTAPPSPAGSPPPSDLHHVDADRHRDGRSTIGNAVLSRWPISAAKTLWLPRPRRRTPVPHAAGGAGRRARADRSRCTAPTSTGSTTPAPRGSCRRRPSPATSAPGAAIRRRATRPIVAGDLNAVPDADEIRLLTGRTAGPVPGLVFQDAWEVAGDGGDRRHLDAPQPVLRRGGVARAPARLHPGRLAPAPPARAILSPAASSAPIPSMACSRPITTLSWPIWPDGRRPGRSRGQMYGHKSPPSDGQGSRLGGHVVQVTRTVAEVRERCGRRGAPGAGSGWCRRWATCTRATCR